MSSLAMSSRGRIATTGARKAGPVACGHSYPLLGIATLQKGMSSRGV